MIDTRRRAKEHRRMIALREVECLLNHRICLCDTRRIEARHFRERGKMACVLLRLRRNGTGIVGNEHDHAALNADIFKAHQRIGGDIKPHLFHRHQHARP